MTKAPSLEARQQLVIRKDVADVFRAFAEPEITSRFWFSRSTGALAGGKSVTWFFDPHGVSALVNVLEFEPNEHIAFEWGNPDGSDMSKVEIDFEPRSENRTLVKVAAYGFSGDGDQVLATALDSMGGFSLVLAAAKAWLEHGVSLAIVADKA